MARGNDAKSYVEMKLAEAFGADYIGKVDNKIYVWAPEGNEKLQIAIAMTCPKTNVKADIMPTSVKVNPFDTPAAAPEAAVMTAEETETINRLIRELGL